MSHFCGILGRLVPPSFQVLLHHCSRENDFRPGNFYKLKFPSTHAVTLERLSEHTRPAKFEDKLHFISYTHMKICFTDLLRQLYLTANPPNIVRWSQHFSGKHSEEGSGRPANPYLPTNERTGRQGLGSNGYLRHDMRNTRVDEPEKTRENKEEYMN